MYDSDEDAIPHSVLGSYEEILDSNRAYNFTDLKESPFINTQARDVEGRQVIIIITNCISQGRQGEHDATRYALKEMHRIISKRPYTFIACLSTVSWANTLDGGFSWIKEPQTSLSLSTPFIPPKFWAKLQSANSLSGILNKLLPQNKNTTLFSHLVQNVEAIQYNQSPLPAFGIPLDTISRICTYNLRSCEHIPETLIRLVKALEHPDVIITRDLFDHQPTSTDIYTTIDVLQAGDWQYDLTRTIPAAATALRLFLGCLPEPLLGTPSFDAFMILARPVEFDEYRLTEAQCISVMQQQLLMVSDTVKQIICSMALVHTVLRNLKLLIDHPKENDYLRGRHKIDGQEDASENEEEEESQEQEEKKKNDKDQQDEKYETDDEDDDEEDDDEEDDDEEDDEEEEVEEVEDDEDDEGDEDDEDDEEDEEDNEDDEDDEEDEEDNEDDEDDEEDEEDNEDDEDSEDEEDEDSKNDEEDEDSKNDEEDEDSKNDEDDNDENEKIEDDNDKAAQKKDAKDKDDKEKGKKKKHKENALKNEG